MASKINNKHLKEDTDSDSSIDMEEEDNQGTIEDNSGSSMDEEDGNQKEILNQSVDGNDSIADDENENKIVDQSENQSEHSEDAAATTDDDETIDFVKDRKDAVKIPVINPMHFIKNKEIRNEIYKKLKLTKMKKQRAARRARRKAGLPRNTGHTIESLRESDQTTVANLNDSENEELQKELELDDFSAYFQGTYIPKIIITFADNPCTRTRKFGLELSRIIPNSLVKIRNRSSVKNIVKSAIREEYTDLIIVNENRHKPNGLLVIHLPNGPTFHFKLSNVQITTDMRRNHKEFTKHRPEIVLTNFTTRLGLTVGRMFGALFNHDPEFRGRRVATFHNQRDFIFFRHHRYEFTKDGKRAKLRELGPRFTLKLRSIQEGTFDSKTGDYAWIVTNKRRAMEGRRRFYL